VLRTSAGDKPYNDLEFYIFMRGSAILAERKYRHILHEMGESLSPDAGLEVEFKVLTLNKLRQSSPSMFYYDLLEGHRWQLGSDALLAGCERHRDPAKIPLHEATRLLMNRCSGLLFSRVRLDQKLFGGIEADFVRRNLAKAQLAFGDVVLAANGQYHWSCRERHARLLKLAAPENLPAAELIRHHATAVEFKLHPTSSSEAREILAAQQAELSELGSKIWLWLEAKRLGTEFASPRDYAFTEAGLCPETSPLRNRLVNFRSFGHRGLGYVSYPRERLFRALALLLWENNECERVRLELRTDAADFSGMISAYENLWKRFN
jgi:hypothetical protein